MNLRQTDFLDDAAGRLARTTDPETSKQSAEEIIEYLGGLQRFALRKEEGSLG